MEIRLYHDSDLADVVSMSAQLGYPVRDDEAANLIHTIVEDPDQILLVAEDESQKPVGWVHAFVARRIFVQPFADLGGLVVDEAARGRQVGAKLLQAAEEWAVDQGCWRMIVRSNVIRERAHRFYLRKEYDVLKQQVVFEKELSPSE